MGNSVQGLTKVQVDNIHSLSLIHQAGHLVIEGDQVGQAGPYTLVQARNTLYKSHRAQLYLFFIADYRFFTQGYVSLSGVLFRILILKVSLHPTV